MKKIFFLFAMMFSAYMISAQTYPDPEFANEIYLLKKDNPYSLVRLEKGASKMETKTNMISGSEQGYSLDGTKSDVRIQGGSNLSFIFSTGSSSSSSNSKSDSAMKANGIDPNMMNFGGMMDPTNNITLYKMDISKGERKIYMMKTGGALPFSNHKNQSSDKYTFSLKKIRDGYWELVIDKTLPKGEYAFTMMAMGMQAMNGGMTLFTFGID
ncbi:MAG TPA: hypothetical protein VHD35_14045 [Chitinophagaceae bacterium]|nr:hypothetical protein [Chitinophagaceae bacterium]